MAAGVRFWVPSGGTGFSNFDRKRKKRIPANQDVTDCLPKLFEPSIVAVSAHEKKFLFAIFQKKRKIIFKKAESEKKGEISPKSGILTSLIDTSASLTKLSCFYFYSNQGYSIVHQSES